MSEEKKPMTVGDLLNKMPKFKRPSSTKTHLVVMVMTCIPWGSIWPHLVFVQAIGLTIMIVNLFACKGDIFKD